jgi:hypothetical protein
MAFKPPVLHGAVVASAPTNTSVPAQALFQIVGLIAPRLSPEMRQNLASIARVVRDHPEIQRTLATDRARVGIARVATPTTLRLALKDIRKCPETERAQLLEELAPRVGRLAPRSSLLGAALFLKRVFALSPSERSGPLAALISKGTGKRKCERDMGFVSTTLWPTFAAFQQKVLDLHASDDDGRVRAVLMHSYEALTNDKRDAEALLEDCDRYPPEHRDSVLCATYMAMARLRCRFDGLMVWQAVLKKALALPVGMRNETLRALGREPEAKKYCDEVKHWTQILALAESLQDKAELAALCEGFAEQFLPGRNGRTSDCSNVPDKSTMMALMEQCYRISDADHARVLTCLAISEGCDYRPHLQLELCDQILTLPPQYRLKPLCTLASFLRFSGMPPSLDLFKKLIEAGKALGGEAYARLLGACARHHKVPHPNRPGNPQTAINLQLVISEIRNLPLRERHWAIEGMASNRTLIRANQCALVEQDVLPLLERLPQEDRHSVVSALVCSLLDGVSPDQYGAERDPHKRVAVCAPPVWRRIAAMVDNLPHDVLADTLLRVVPLLTKADSPAWGWALTQARKLPVGLRLPVLDVLGKTEDFDDDDGSVGPIHRYISAVGDLAPHYRGGSLWRADEASRLIGNIFGLISCQAHLGLHKLRMPALDNWTELDVDRAFSVLAKLERNAVPKNELPVRTAYSAAPPLS